MGEKKRLSKVLAGCGVASRRAAEEIIFEGRVEVNGEVVTVPQTGVCLEEDTITVDGKPLKKEQKKVYYLLNKPIGYICSNKRTSKRSRLVIDLFSQMDQRLFTVGRLDKDTEGLIVVTNDGHFADKLIHPSSNIQKEYVVKTGCDIKPEHLYKLSEGTTVEGTFVKPVKVQKIRKGTLKIVVKEGKKHEVRELVLNAGLKVKNLKRTRVGHLTLGSLETGNYRPLSKKEIETVWQK